MGCSYLLDVLTRYVVDLVFVMLLTMLDRLPICLIA